MVGEDRWIGLPDLNPINFYVWSHVRQLVYAIPVNNIQELCQHIQRSFEQIRNTKRQRVELCIAEDGAHFEYLILKLIKIKHQLLLHILCCLMFEFIMNVLMIKFK